MVPTATNSNSKIIVSKFGGTSMGDAECMLRSAMVSLERGALAVVVSATSGTTNQLIEIGKRAEIGDWSFCEGKITEIEQRHLNIAAELKSHLSADHQNFASAQLAALFDELRSLAVYSYDKKPITRKMQSSRSPRRAVQQYPYYNVLFAEIHKRLVLQTPTLISAEDGWG